MADKVGDIYYEAHVRGDNLPRELRKVGREAGDGLGNEIGDALEKRLKTRFSQMSSELLPGLRKDGRISARGFTDAFENVLVSRIRGLQSEIAEVFADQDGLDNFAKRFKSASEAADDLRGKLRTLNDEGGLNETMFGRLSGALDEWADKQREATVAQEDANRRRRESINALSLEIASMDRKIEADDREVESTKRRDSATERLTRTVDRQRDKFNQWARSSDGAGRRMTRLTKIVLLVTAALPQMIALSSAVGAGLTIVAGAALAGVVGLGALGLSMIGLQKPLSELPENVRPAAAAFQGFIQSVKDSQKELQAAAAGGLEAGFLNLQAMVEGLTPALQALGAAAGETFAKFTAGLAPGTAGFERLQTILGMSAPLFDGLMATVSNLGAALGNVFIALGPSMEAFVGYLVEITQAFAEWSGSEEGRQSILEWGQNAQTIMGALSDLIRALSDMFADIVTPELVASFTSFIEQLTGFIPTLGSIIKLVEDLRIFDIIGALFETLTPVIDALMPYLSEFANVLGTAVIDALGELQGPLTELAKALGPILTALAPIIPIVLKLVTALVGALVPAIAPLLTVIAELVTQVVDALEPALTPLIDVFMEMAGPILELVSILLTALMPIIGPLVQLLAKVGGSVQEMMIPAFDALLVVLKLLEPVLNILGFLVGALIETIVALITGDFSAIPGIWEDAWKGMQDAVQGVVDFLTPFINDLVNFIGDSITNIQNFFTNFTSVVEATWNSFWGNLGNVVKTLWNNVLGFIEGGVNGAIDLINGLIKAVNSVSSTVGITLGTIPKVSIPRLASGTIAYGRMQAIIGEAGPEAVVPLNRPLSQVDPAVRDLSAYAQGKTYGSGNGPQRVVNIEQGAISVVTPAANPVLVASMVVDEITENALN